MEYWFSKPIGVVTHAAHLFGGPHDGNVVYMSDPNTPSILISCFSQGNNTLWVKHLYEKRDGRYEFVHTEIDTTKTMFDYDFINALAARLNQPRRRLG